MSIFEIITSVSGWSSVYVVNVKVEEEPAGLMADRKNVT